LRAGRFQPRKSPSRFFAVLWRKRHKQSIKLHWRNIGRSPAIVIDCIFKIIEESALGPTPDYSGAHPLAIRRTIAVDALAETTEVGPAPIGNARRGAQLVFFGRLTYTELNGTEHHTGFALKVAPNLPAYAQYQNPNYDYYDKSGPRRAPPHGAALLG
jgi:hypothetical protein